MRIAVIGAGGVGGPFGAALCRGGHDVWSVSDGVFARLFDRRPDAIGRTFWIDDRPYVVIGVMPG